MLYTFRDCCVLGSWEEPARLLHLLLAADLLFPSSSAALLLIVPPGSPFKNYPHINKFMACRSAKNSSSASRLYRGGVEASASEQVFLFQIIVICGLLLWKTPLLADGLRRAGAKEVNYLRIGAREGFGDEAVLHGSPYTATVERPSVSFLLDLFKEEDEPEEILSVKLKLLRGKASAFRVFINLPDADEQTSVTRPEFAGSYFHEPRRVKSPDFEYQETIFSIGIGDIIRGLGLMEQPSVQVTFVPSGADKALPVVLESVQIELA